MSHDPHTPSTPGNGEQPSYKLPFTIPTWLIYLLVLSVVASWIPLALIARSRATHSAKPRVHIFQDMDVQPRFGPQAWAGPDGAQLKDALFADSRAARPPVPGAVAAHDDAARLDDHYYRGYTTDGNLKPKLTDLGGGKLVIADDAFIDGLPAQIKVDRALLERGRERYNIYCAVCHGEAGYGDGPVHRRVEFLLNLAAEQGKTAPETSPAAGWAVPRNFHEPRIVDFPAGRLFHVASEGFNTMRGYKQQVTVADRWAIVAYIRALQASKRVPIEVAKAKFAITDDIIARLPPPPEKQAEAPKPTNGDKPAEDEPWLKDPELIAQGKTLFTTKICATCHQVDPAVPSPAGEALKAPKFLGKFWGQKVVVTKGPGGEEMEVVFNAEYVMHSIAEPMALIRKGSIPGMAPLPTTPEERKALAAYIRSLSE